MPREHGSPVTVREIIEQLDAIEGASFFHGARFYSSSADLELMRFRTAKKLAAAGDVARTQYLEKLRLFRASGCSMGCCYCNCSFLSLDEAEVVGDRLLHRACQVEWNAFLDARIEVTPAGKEALESNDCGVDWEAEAEDAIARLAASDR